MSETWCSYKIAGSPVGYIHETLVRTEAGAHHSTMEVVIVTNRLGNKVEIRGKSQSDETKELDFSRFRAEITSSKQKTVVEGQIGTKELTVLTRTGEKDYTRKIPFGERLQGPEAARNLCLQKLKDKGDVVAYRTFVSDFPVRVLQAACYCV
ncbi:hypothetical protein KIH39_08365 [Telmatocola sphagniphila]|uniref:Uncharacterized protein n=1 Tax=Telmatocola sphagniphila TaxID=1123043 RepID=A0A8E6BBL8_9BACT|nr:hypothetical protein [Telmatocola sphagniphila]QVL33905.1 hypothetical protein KIH39_08365 [Telmatocola sphagniphila]